MTRARELVVIGGGFSGACMALSVARDAASFAVRITVIETRESIGQGIAYQTEDPEHRLNAPVYSHSIFPDDADHLMRWCERNGVFDRDPQALTSQGPYIRRADFARYIADLIRQFEPTNPGTSITHRRALATDIERGAIDGRWRVSLDDGQELSADMVVIATGNPPARVPRMLANVADHAGFIASPWDRRRMLQIRSDQRVAIVGAALTSADVLASLIARGHQAGLVAFSRHGLRPAEQNPSPEAAAPISGAELCERLSAPLPEWLLGETRISETTKPMGPRQLTRALRERIEQTAGELPWQVSFDELRNAVWRLWPGLTTAQKRQYLRHLRPWYDAHRFRIAPQTLELLEQASASGQLQFITARLVSAEPKAGTKDLSLALEQADGQTMTLDTQVLINCTGFNLSAPASADSLLGRLMAKGDLSADRSSIGYCVDTNGAVIDPTGQPKPTLRMIGPPTAGVWGDPLGAVFIAMQIRRLMPDLLHCLHSTQGDDID